MCSRIYYELEKSIEVGVCVFVYGCAWVGGYVGMIASTANSKSPLWQVYVCAYMCLWECVGMLVCGFVGVWVSG